MAVPVRQNLVPSSKYSIKCPYAMTPTRIVVHNTANDASANNEISYMRSNDKKVSFHYAVDNVEIVQGIPENRNAWHAGDGSGKGNREGIGIEICYSKNGGDRFVKAEQNAAWFVSTLLKKYGWGIDKITKHQDYSGKYCPHRTLDLGWSRFLNMVSSNLSVNNPPMATEKEKVLVEFFTTVWPRADIVKHGVVPWWDQWGYAEVTASYKVVKTENDKLKAEKDALNKKIGNLEQDVKNLNVDVKKQKDEVTGLKDQLGETSEVLEALEREKSAWEGEKNTLEEMNKVLREQNIDIAKDNKILSDKIENQKKELAKLQGNDSSLFVKIVEWLKSIRR